MQTDGMEQSSWPSMPMSSSRESGQKQQQPGLLCISSHHHTRDPGWLEEVLTSQRLYEDEDREQAKETWARSTISKAPPDIYTVKGIREQEMLVCP